jgi:hypothetical protein
MQLTRIRWFVIAGALALLGGPAAADPFCCVCKDGKQYPLDESNMAMAGTKCSLKCKRPTLAKEGSCEVPAPAPSAAAPSAATSASAMLFKSDDCSGESMKIDKSNTKLDGIRSYQVDSGVVTAYEKADYAGASMRPVVGSMCVSPGWAIGSVKVGQ